MDYHPADRCERLTPLVEDFCGTLAVSRELPCQGKVLLGGISGFLPVGGSWATDDSLSPLRERFQLRVQNYKRLTGYCQPRVILFLPCIFKRKTSLSPGRHTHLSAREALKLDFSFPIRRVSVPWRGRDILTVARRLSTLLHP